MFDSLKQKADAWLKGRMDSATNEYIQKYATDESGKVDTKLAREINVEAARGKVITKHLYWDEPLMWVGAGGLLGFASGILQRLVGNGNGNGHGKTTDKDEHHHKHEKSPLSWALQGAAIASLSAAAISLIRIPQRAELSFRSRIESKLEAHRAETELAATSPNNQVTP